jgi:predicted Rossmann fold nucleotide-binding protein DprA/Smf involved in DNA uptake
MGRNKLIYALSDVAVVVSSADGSGGTWTGAVEALDGGWVPVLVRDEAGVPAGNQALMRRGASPLRRTDLAGTVTPAALRELAARHASSGAEPMLKYDQQRLFE